MNHHDHDTLVTIDWLRGLPHGAVVCWASDHITARKPWATAWVDVRVPDGGPPGMGWVWTIDGFEIADDDDASAGETDDAAEEEEDLRVNAWEFVWPYDLDVHGVWPPGESWYVNEWVAPRGASLPEPVAVMYEHFPETFGGDHTVRGGWSAAAVTRAVATWAVVYAGCTDLHFEWDVTAGPSAILREVEARARGQADGAPVWDLGNGVSAGDAVMDELLAEDPEVAARVVAAAKEARETLLNRERRESE